MEQPTTEGNCSLWTRHSLLSAKNLDGDAEIIQKWSGPSRTELQGGTRSASDHVAPGELLSSSEPWFSSSVNYGQGQSPVPEFCKG